MSPFTSEGSGQTGASHRLPTATMLLGLLLVVASAGSAIAHGGHHEAGYEAVQPTDQYLVTLAIGHQESMRTAEHATGASEGEVMVRSVAMPTPKALVIDQGHPVNRHVEVRVREIATGKPPADANLRILITDQATGGSRDVSPVVKMHGIKEGPSDLHFGNNVYLPDGTYTITVMTGSETAVFKDVVLKGS